MLTDTSSSLLRSGSSSLKTETKKNNNKMHFLVPLCHFVQQNECHKMKRERGEGGTPPKQIICASKFAIF